VPIGIFPNSLKKEAHCCLEQTGEGGTHPELPGKGEGEAEGWGKESFQAQCMRDYWSSLLSRLILPKGSTGALEARGDLHSRATETMKKTWEIWLYVCHGHGWRSLRLSHLWSLRVGQEVASSAFGWHQEVPQPEHLLWLEDKLSFHWLFLDLLSSGSDLEIES
jgi:hypothetical protein